MKTSRRPLQDVLKTSWRDVLTRLNEINPDINSIKHLVHNKVSHLFIRFWNWNNFLRSYFPLHINVHFFRLKLTCWLPTTSILVIIRRIYRYQLKWNYLQNYKHFLIFYCISGIFINFGTFSKKTSLIARVFRKLLTPKDVLT